MSLQKVDYIDGETIIMAKNLNDIQDELIATQKNSISKENLKSAVADALQQAKDQGTFNGKTPVKGTDYWTSSDKQEIVNDVLAQIPHAKGVSF